MKSAFGRLGVALLFASSWSHGASGGTISGTVKGPDGAPFKGAFVRAQNTTSRIIVDVLSDRQGGYRIQDLAPGKYEVRATAVGYKTDPHGDVMVDAVQPVSLNFALQKGMVRWTDLSIYQGQLLLPEDPGKKVLFTKCQACHSFATKVAATVRDEDGWRGAVSFMRDSVGVGDKRASDQDVAVLVPYLTRMFGPDSELPRSPAELPGYEKATHAEFSDEAMKIVYVEYSLPGPNRIPWNAHPDNKGNVWIPCAKTADKFAELNIETGKVREWSVPLGVRHALDVHSAMAAPDGTVWYVEGAGGKLGRFDPKTEEISEYPLPGGAGNAVRIDRLGYIWASAGAGVVRFDPKTRKFITFSEIPHPYGIEVDNYDNVWSAQFTNSEYPTDGLIGKIDINTLKVSVYTPPTTTKLASLNKEAPFEEGNAISHPKDAGTKRIAVDSKGIVYFGEWWGGQDGQHGQIGRFDPKTETFKEYPLPDPAPTPYGIGVDHNDFVWYNSNYDDILGRLDPATGTVVEYPFPYSDNGIREIVPDAAGRMWFTTPFNNKAGYFIPPK